MLRGKIAVLPDRQHCPAERQHHHAHTDSVDETVILAAVKRRLGIGRTVRRVRVAMRHRGIGIRVRVQRVRHAPGGGASKKQHHGGAECRQQRDNPDMFEKKACSHQFSAFSLSLPAPLPG